MSPSVTRGWPSRVSEISRGERRADGAESWRRAGERVRRRRQARCTAGWQRRKRAMERRETTRRGSADCVEAESGIGTRTSKKPPPVMSTWKICLHVKSRSTGVASLGSAIRSSSRPVEVAPIETPNSTRARSAQWSGSRRGAMSQKESTPHTSPAAQTSAKGAHVSAMMLKKGPSPVTPGGRPDRPSRAMAVVMRRSCAVFETRTIVSRSMKDLPERWSVKCESTTDWSARPAMRQKRKSGRTESRLDRSRNEPAGKASSSSTIGTRSK
mmetsp:Transcript_2752/g.9053  ORF Transcript_2752/g.9053 Transcript_2752/m.9053 type:complete len:270 (-) Transcript_2752:1097-1906(-)